MFPVPSGSGETSWFTTTDFPAHVDQLHQENDKLFEDEYSVSAGIIWYLISEYILSFQSVSKEPLSQYKESQIPYNVAKNRFGNVFPCK